MKKVIAERKDIAFYIKMLPLVSIHPNAYEKAKAIVCEKSLALLEDAFNKKELPKPKCETSIVEDNLKLGQKLGISGTPTLIFSDGRVHSGYMDSQSLMKEIGN